MAVQSEVRCWGGPALATPPGVSSVLMLAAGHQFTCIYENQDPANPSVLCWGNVQYSEKPGDEIWSLAAGGDHACYINSVSGEVKCWGSNSWGQTNVPFMGPAQSLALGEEHSCAILFGGGAMKCWGKDIDGQLNQPASLGGVDGTLVSAACGDKYTCASQTPLPGGSAFQGVYCWGGEDEVVSRIPANVKALTDAPELYGGYAHVCAKEVGGDVHCWGESDYGRLAVPFIPVGDRAGTAVAAGEEFTCFAFGSTGLACSGKNADAPPNDLGKVHLLAAGDTFACAYLDLELPATETETTTATATTATATETTTSTRSTITTTTTRTSTRTATSVSTTSSAVSTSTTSRTLITSSATGSTTRTSSSSGTASVTTPATSSTSKSSSTSATSTTTSFTSGRTYTTSPTVTLSGNSPSTAADAHSTAPASAATMSSTSSSRSASSSTSSTSLFESSVSTAGMATSSVPATTSLAASTSISEGARGTTSIATARLDERIRPASTRTTLSRTTTTRTRTTRTRTTRPRLNPNLPTTTTTTDGVLEKARAVGDVLRQSVSKWQSANGASHEAAADAVGNETSVVETELGRVTIVALAYAASRAEAATYEEETGGKVALSPPVLREIPRQGLMVMLRVTTEALEAGVKDIVNTSWREKRDPFALMRPLASQVLDVSIFSVEGERIPVTLTSPLLFRLPGSRERGRCVYLDTESWPVRWSTRGVWTATDADVLAASQDPAGIWCYTTHLSIFAALEEALVGCTNLELLTPGAVRAILGNEAWYEQRSAFIVFVVWAILVATALAGLVSQRWALRLGSTAHTRKPVNVCRGFMQWGPHVLKHQYAVFVVYARDILHCLVTDKTQLKNQTLTFSCQRFLAVRTHISLGTVQQHCWNGSDWIDSDVSLPHTVLCRKLEFHSGAAERVIQEDIFAPGRKGVVRRFVLTFLAINPLFDAVRVGHGSYTVGKRVTLQVASICGVMATNALIFTFSGALRSWEADADCPINTMSHFYVVIATWVSVMMNILPTSFLSDLAKQIYRRPLWLLFFWLMLLAYLSCTVLVVVVAMANLNAADQELWYSILEWGMVVKLLGMPFAQALRNSILLEAFLRKDQRCPAEERFRVIMGLTHPNETELGEAEKEEAERMARQAISAEELVRFTALLGDIVMPEFSADTSTSEDVLHCAIEPLCLHPPHLEDYPVKISVREVRGLLPSDRELTCRVLHLGEQYRHERDCLDELSGDAAPVETQEGLSCCSWNMEAAFAGVDTTHALGFRVHGVDGRVIGVATLNMEQVLLKGGWSGVLPLHATQSMAQKQFAMPTEAGQVPHKQVCGSRGHALSGSMPHAHLSLTVDLPKGYMEAIGLKELLKMKNASPENPGDSGTQLESLAKARARALPDWSKVISAGAFCEARTYKGECLPPHKMVVHTGKGNFVDLVTAVLVDAMGKQHIYKQAYNLVYSALLEKDFFTIHDMLQETGGQGTRYWIDIFAMEPIGYYQQQNNGANRHESFMSLWPTILRAMRHFSAQKMVMDISSGRVAGNEGPLTQLLVLDRRFQFMHENSCLAELMLARALRVRQKLILHPDHLKGSSLGVELRRLEEELADAYDEEEVSYMSPYLEDPQAVFEAVRDLAVSGVKEHRDDDEATWQELDMTDVLHPVGANRAGYTTTLRQGQEGDNSAQIDMNVDIDT